LKWTSAPGGTVVGRQNKLTAFAAVREAEDGPSRPILRRNRMSAFGWRSQPVDATLCQLAVNNDDGLLNARPNPFSESLRNQLSHNVIFSAALVPPRNH
jgi:hypothetical protein